MPTNRMSEPMSSSSMAASTGATSGKWPYFIKTESVSGSSCDPEFEKNVNDILATLHLGDETLRRVMSLMLKEMELGLEKGGTSRADIKMLPSYVCAIPNGREAGHFLALDLGGTNFRVLLIKLANGKSEMASKIYRIPHEIMIGSGETLFDHIAACLAQFMKDEKLSGQKLPLGFTFSFPCDQSGLTCGSLVTWTKGFKCSNVEGQDVVQLLAKAVRKRQDIDIDVVALLNDTVGTLMALGYTDQRCQIGVIVGTGSNACYLERVDRCPKLDDFADDDHHEMIINTEWGAFGNNGCLAFIRTKYDDECDKHSINAGKQLFEKMISGMYMGELVRLVLVDLVQKGLLFHGVGSEDLFTRGKFPTKYVSEIESDRLSEELSYSNTLNICEDLGIENVTMNDCLIIGNVCSAVSTRAAYLSAAGISVLLNRMQKPDVTVGVDGSVYRFHPTFRFLLQEKISHLIDVGLKFSLKLSEDGSGRGAALVAAVACRVKLEKLQRQEQLLTAAESECNAERITVRC